VDRVKHLGHGTQHDIDDGVDDGETENALFEVPENAIPEL
jgi:hypothetical protein